MDTKHISPIAAFVGIFGLSLIVGWLLAFFNLFTNWGQIFFISALLSTVATLITMMENRYQVLLERIILLELKLEKLRK